MHHITRRRFLASTTVTTAGLAAGMQIFPTRAAWATTPASAWLPDLSPDDALRSLALQAVDAAYAAGASYADIRLDEMHGVSTVLTPSDPRLRGRVYLRANGSFGIRVLVDGAWGFMYGVQLTPESVTRTAQDAVATTKGYATLAKRPATLVSMPAVTGEWMTPIDIDPFTVPLQQQTNLLGSLLTAAGRVRGTSINRSELSWTRSLRVFASTEGSLITQRLYHGSPSLPITAMRGMAPITRAPSESHARSGGYEIMLAPDLYGRVIETAEEAAEFAALRPKDLDVGRYPVVFDGGTVASVLGATIGQAAELDRLLGHEADASGGSFLGPGLDRLGDSLFSPLLTVAGHTPSSSISYRKWDDEGVAIRAYPVISNGVWANVHASRSTVSEIPGADDSQESDSNTEIKPAGCVHAVRGLDQPRIRPPHLSMTAGTQATSVNDLYHDIERGVIVFRGRADALDQQQGSGNIRGQAFLVEHGKITHRLSGSILQFKTEALWKTLSALGDARTVQYNTVSTPKGMPWVSSVFGCDAPACRFDAVDVIRIPSAPAGRA